MVVRLNDVLAAVKVVKKDLDEINNNNLLILTQASLLSNVFMLLVYICVSVC